MYREEALPQAVEPYVSSSRVSPISSSKIVGFGGLQTYPVYASGFPSIAAFLPDNKDRGVSAGRRDLRRADVCVRFAVLSAEYDDTCRIILLPSMGMLSDRQKKRYTTEYFRFHSDILSSIF